jgi:hypothetical protein
MFCGIFFGMVGPRFCWEFWRKWVVGRGFLVVKLWWIACERWSVDGQDSGSKNMPLFPDLFLRDSHFGNSVLKTARTIGEVSGINLVDDTGEFMVISPFDKIICSTPNPSVPPGRSTQGVKLLDLEPQDKVAAL